MFGEINPKVRGMTNNGLFSQNALTLTSLSPSEAVVTNSSNLLTSLAYTNANTASTIVSRDGSGNFSAGTITASLTGAASLNLLTSNNLSDIPSPSTAATNLGLGTGSNVTFTNLTLSGLSASQPVLTNGSKQLSSGTINLASASFVSGILGGANGGTGTNNGSSTFTMGGSVTFSGAFTFTGNLTNNTNVTFPTSGTLATTSGTTSAIYQDFFCVSRCGGL